MNVANVTEITSLWDIPIATATSIAPKVIRIVSMTDEQFILKKKVSPNAAEREVKLLHYLVSKGIHVHPPLLGLNNEYVQLYEDECYCIYPYIDGRHYTAMEAIHHQQIPIILGEILASLHKEMQTFNDTNGYLTKEIYHQVYDWAVPTISNVYNDKQLQQIYDEVNTSFKELTTSLPTQLIHRDAHLSNILMNNHKLSSFIDFELVEVNIRMFDLCYCATSVLSEVFASEELREDWITFVSTLVKNYMKHNPLSNEELQAIPYIMLAIQSIFMAYFIDNKLLYTANREMLLWIYKQKLIIYKGVSE